MWKAPLSEGLFACDMLGTGGSFSEIVISDYVDGPIVLGHDGPFHSACAAGLTFGARRQHCKRKAEQDAGQAQRPHGAVGAAGQAEG